MKTLSVLIVYVAACATAATAAAPPSTLTLSANPIVVTYGKTTALAGQLAPAKANQNIAIQAQECGKTTFAKVATVKTAANSTFTTAATPTGATTYQASLKAAKSPTVTVTVRPLAELARVARGSFTAKITAGQSLAGKYVVFQRYAKVRKRWVRVKKVSLTTATPGTTKPTTISSAAFKAKVARRTRVRVVLNTAQAAPCYLSVTSNVVRA